jgi:hypothetical protein
MRPIRYLPPLVAADGSGHLAAPALFAILAPAHLGALSPSATAVAHAAPS